MGGLSLSLILYLRYLAGTEQWALLIQWQIPLKDLAECLGLNLLEELELALRRTIPPGLDLTASLDSVTQKSV